MSAPGGINWCWICRHATTTPPVCGPECLQEDE